jgi:hypothetical protein
MITPQPVQVPVQTITPSNIAQLESQKRIAELTTLIEKKRIRGYDVSAEIAELEELDPIL